MYLQQQSLCRHKCIFGCLLKGSSYGTAHIAPMPRLASKESSVDKSKVYLKQALKRGDNTLKFFQYQDKGLVIYKLNRYHYLETNKIVVSFEVIRYLAQLAKTPNSFEQIGFDLCRIQDEGCIEFMKGNWNNLFQLDLNSNCLTKRAIEALVKPANLSKLKQLSLNDNLLDAQAGAVLSQGVWKNLESLHLNFNSLGCQGLKALSGHCWTRLKQLHLLSNNIANAGISGLVSMNVPHLQKLLLSNNVITDDGCKALARGQWKQLKSLELDGNFLKNDALLYLTRLGCFNLGSLELFGSKTYVIDSGQKQESVPTIGGLSWLVKGCWNRVKVQVALTKLGPMSRQSFIVSVTMRQMLELANVTLTLTNKF